MKYAQYVLKKPQQPVEWQRLLATRYCSVRQVDHVAGKPKGWAYLRNKRWKSLDDGHLQLAKRRCRWSTARPLRTSAVLQGLRNCSKGETVQMSSGQAGKDHTKV